MLGCCQNNANWCPLTLTRRASGRTELALVGDSGMQAAMALHGFPEEIQYGVAVTALRHKGFQDFPFLTGGSLNLVGDTVDLHEDLVELPAPGGQRPHSLHAFPPDLGGEHRAKPVPTEANHLMADVDPPLMQQVLDIPERLQAADVEHTARLMISGEALKERKGLRWVIPRGKAADRIASTNLVLTRPLEQLTGLI